MTVGSGLQDLAGRLLADPLSLPLEIAPGDPSFVAYETPDPSVSPTSGAAFRYTFHGLERDATTGLVYARNRWYDPELGRFISTDPLGYVDGPNLYAFAGNDPANGSDPLGLERISLQQKEGLAKAAKLAREERKANREPTIRPMEPNATAGALYYVADNVTVGIFSSEYGAYSPLYGATQPAVDLARFKEEHPSVAGSIDLADALLSPGKVLKIAGTGLAVLGIWEGLDRPVKITVPEVDGGDTTVWVDPRGKGSVYRDPESGLWREAPAALQRPKEAQLVERTTDLSSKVDELEKAEEFRRRYEQSQEAMHGVDAFGQMLRSGLEKVRRWLGKVK